MASLSLQSRIQRKLDVLFVDITGETVMLNMATAEYIKIDTIGAAIWQRLEQPVTVADLVVDLVESYQGDRDVIEADVLDFLEQISAKRLLVECP
jgi:hypothetical protein